MRTMLQALVSTASRWLDNWSRSLEPERVPLTAQRGAVPSVVNQPYQSLRRVVLTDGICHSLFEEYAAHLAGDRGDEEIGWVLLGTREVDEAIVLATLPAGAERHASASHVKFNPLAQAVGSKIVRQWDRRLVMLGVVHTHPGSLRHPSDADFRGDSPWVQNLRGAEGIFGIGTADARPDQGTMIGRQPKPSVQCLGKLQFSWYALKHGDRHYRPLPVHMTIGPDLAQPLHAVWPTVEAHAGPLERLFRQQAGMAVDVAHEAGKAALVVSLPLAERGDLVRLVLTEKEVQYYLLRNGQLTRADLPADRIDRAVYLLLAELTAGVD